MLLNVFGGVGKGGENNKLTIFILSKRIFNFLLNNVVFGVNTNIIAFKPLGVDALQKFNIAFNRVDKFFSEQAFFNRNGFLLDFVQINTKLVDATDFIKRFLDFLIIGFVQVSTLFNRNVSLFPPLNDVFIRGQNTCKR